MSLKPLHNGSHSGATRPVSLRLTHRDIEQLHARAVTVSGTVTGIARELILTGLADGGNQALAKRRMHIERRLTAIDGAIRDLAQHASQVEQALKDVGAKFNALLNALSVEGGT